ncbi:pseudouridine synthase [endosymbiont of unidentified scaly snail isolate Monju]|uniref:pseudouridine synthase n=1 Tax=endosymbiont of unidentified scaly snail isolate Monju TaxID=1248727 RepID=UPI00038920EB|nr:pseudouridine synthase [endosymbiont of unidentified scaly snail isolate Monju]BAN69874.1 tRNA pseudouridine65 synthase [endosymbiont of unidentified scaly snail isolate Monju]
MSLPILYLDDHLVAIHKPSGLLVHRSPLSRDRVFALQQLRDQLGRRVWPVHRIDRATSGVLLFALDPATTQALAGQFERHEVEKEYRALVRGWTDKEGVIDHPVRDEEGHGRPQPAITRYRRLHRVELPEPVDRYPTSRYSLVAVTPLTGRRHQIRRHFKHISHHLIGDTTHGNGRHNRFFRERFGIHRLMLTAQRLCLTHPVSGERLCLNALPEPEWLRLFDTFGWKQPDMCAKGKK